MAACGAQGAFARLERNRDTGELQLVYVLRGAAATEFLNSIKGVRPRWARGVMRAFDPSRDGRRVTTVSPGLS